MPEKISRQQLAKLVTETIDTLFPFEYASDDLKEIESQLAKDLNTIDGCQSIIHELCNMILESE